MRLHDVMNLAKPDSLVNSALLTIVGREGGFITDEVLVAQPRVYEDFLINSVLIRLLEPDDLDSVVFLLDPVSSLHNVSADESAGDSERIHRSEIGSD